MSFRRLGAIYNSIRHVTSYKASNGRKQGRPHMFNSTHSLLGIAIARSGLDRWTPHATTTAIVASNLPDIDAFTLFADSAIYLEHHRGITHSVFAIPFMAAFLAGLIYRLSFHSRGGRGNFRGLFGICFIVMMTHPLLDYLTPYGMRPFLPFEDAWIYGDTLFIVDPTLDAILLLGVIGTYWLPRHRTVCGVVTLLAIVLYVGARVELRSRARVHLAEFVRTIPETTQTAILPQMLSPFRWTGIVESDTKLWKLPVDTGTGPGQAILEIEKMPYSVRTRRAAQAPTAAALLGFARFPFMLEQKLEDGYRVYFVDFRFYSETSGLASAVVLDGNLDILADDWSFNRQIGRE